MKFKKHRFYHIKWLDHVSQDDVWLEGEGDLEPICVNSVGYVVRDRVGDVLFSLNASELSNDPQTSCHMLVLKSDIVFSEEMDIFAVPHE